MGAIIEGFLLGLGAAVPLGPINVLIMTQALRNYPMAVAIGAGAMSADITYLVLILFGIFHFLKDPLIMNIMSLGGAIFLLYLAWLIFKNRNEPISMESGAKHTPKGLAANYFKGYMLTLMNPYTVVFWLSVSTYISSKNLDPYATIGGLFCAIVMWITLMPLLIHKSKHLFSQRTATIFSLISAAILGFFALGMFANLLQKI